MISNSIFSNSIFDIFNIFIYVCPLHLILFIFELETLQITIAMKILKSRKFISSEIVDNKISLICLYG